MQIEENVLLAPYTTLKIGGPARYFARVTSEDELVEAVEFGRERGLPLFVLGGGSNLVVADEGFDGLVIHVAIDGQIQSNENYRQADDKNLVYLVPGGMNWDTLVKFVCERGLCGIECLAGIPGLVGSSPVQNIGAYGQEVSQAVTIVRAFDTQSGNYANIPAEACGFGYRSSIFNGAWKGRYLITRVFFRFQPDVLPSLQYVDLQKHFAGKARPTPIDVYDAVRAIRAGKGMLIDPATSGPDERSAGSFFKNPVVSARVVRDILETLPPDEGAMPQWPTEDGRVKLAAAWLIEHAGFKKGYALGRVGISSKHTLALVNRTGDASCEELLRLRDLIVLTVEQRFGVTLAMEPVMLG